MERKSKNSFLLYTDYIKHISLLSDQEAGQLFKALFQFVDDGVIPDFSGALAMCFSFISLQIQRDNEKYIDICEKRAEAGRKGGKQKQANLANANFVKQKQANLADNDTVTDTDTENKTDIKNIWSLPDQKNETEKNYTAEFEAFWSVYPRKVGKGDAYKKYKARLKDGWSEAELLEAARHYADRVTREKTEQKYIKHAKTFLSESTPFIDDLPKKQEAKPAAGTCDDDNPYADWR